MPVAKVSQTRVMEFIKTPIDDRDKKFTPEEIVRFTHESKIRAKRNMMELVWMSQGLNERTIKEVFTLDVMCRLIHNISLILGEDAYDYMEYVSIGTTEEIENLYMQPKPRMARKK